MSTSAVRVVPGSAAPASAPGDFVHDSLPGRIVFGAGASTGRLPSELDRLQIGTVLLIASGSQVAGARRLVMGLGGRGAGVLELPGRRSRSDLVQVAVDAVRGGGVDGFLVVGGGSAIGLAKSAAAAADVPLVALPTTYSGAELSRVHRTGERNERLGTAHAPPSAVIYDPRLTITLTPELTASSAMSALANGVEALCCTNGSPVSALVAEEGIRHIAEGARDAVLHPEGLLGRSLTQFGAYLTGASAAVTAPGLLQTASEAVTVVSGVSYADARAVIVPHYLAAQRDSRPLVLATIAGALGWNDAVEGLHEFAQDVGAPRSLFDLGVTAEQVSTVVERCRDRSGRRTRSVLGRALPEIMHAALVGS